MISLNKDSMTHILKQVRQNVITSAGKIEDKDHAIQTIAETTRFLRKGENGVAELSAFSKAVQSLKNSDKRAGHYYRFLISREYEKTGLPDLCADALQKEIDGMPEANAKRWREKIHADKASEGYLQLGYNFNRGPALRLNIG